MNNKTNKLIPELRFPEFVNDGEWNQEELGSCLDYLQPTNYLVNSTAYNDKYTIPVLTAGKTFILGYTNEEDGVFSKKLPVIIFDDFTTASKYVDFPFKVKSSAMKILLAKKSNNIKFIFESMQMIKYEVGVHGRHWISVFSILKIPFPSPTEQQKVASCLTSLDELLNAYNDKIENLKNHKKGLMQNVFPQEGEKVPKFRFKEFEKEGDWTETKLGEYLLQNPEYGINAAAVPFSEKLPKYLRITDISEDGRIILNNKVSVDKDVTENNYLSDGDIVLARTGASVGKSYKYRIEDGRLVFAGFLIRVKPNKQKLVSEFLFQFLSTNHYWKWVSFISARSGQPGINGTEYSSMPIKLPPRPEEQQKIADILYSLDNLIKEQVNKIEQLKLHKIGLMQGLFPKVKD